MVAAFIGRAFLSVNVDEFLHAQADSNNTGFGDSYGFNLDTSEGGGNENPVNLDNSGFQDSSGFVLNTTDNNDSHAEDPTFGFSDSGGFVLDTTDSQGSDQSGFGDSYGFILDTTGEDGNHSDGNGTGGPNQPPADLVPSFHC